jgi:hypothetical protein
MRRFIFKALLFLILLPSIYSINVILNHIGLSFKLSLFIVCAIITLCYGRLEKWFAHVTDKYLFQKEYDYWGVMNQISDDFDKMKDTTYPGDLKKYIISAITNVQIRQRAAA